MTEWLFSTIIITMKTSLPLRALYTTVHMYLHFGISFLWNIRSREYIAKWHSDFSPRQLKPWRHNYPWEQHITQLILNTYLGFLCFGMIFHWNGIRNQVIMGATKSETLKYFLPRQCNFNQRDITTQEGSIAHQWILTSCGFHSWRV